MRPNDAMFAVAILTFAGCGVPPPDTLLTLAARDGDIAALQDLLSDGVDPNRADSSGWTPIIWAVRAGHARSLEVLLAAGADPDLRDLGRNGWTPLMHALHRDHEAVAWLLLEHGADPGAPSGRGGTPLWMAAGYGQFRTVEELLARGVDPRSAPDGGRALFTNAVGGAWDIDYRWRGCREHARTVGALLAAAPDLQVEESFRGRYALRTIRRRGCSSIVQMLDGDETGRP